MATLKSRISILRIASLLLYSFTGCVAIWLIWFGLINMTTDAMAPYLLFSMGVALCYFSAYGFRWDYRTVPALTLDDQKLDLGKQGTFNWSELDSITLHTTKKVSGKSRSKDRYWKAIMINFHNEKAIYLFDAMYSNIEEIRVFLRDHVMNTHSA